MIPSRMCVQESSPWWDVWMPSIIKLEALVNPVTEFRSWLWLAQTRFCSSTQGWMRGRMVVMSFWQVTRVSKLLRQFYNIEAQWHTYFFHNILKPFEDDPFQFNSSFKNKLPRVKSSIACVNESEHSQVASNLALGLILDMKPCSPINQDSFEEVRPHVGKFHS